MYLKTILVAVALLVLPACGAARGPYTKDDGPGRLAPVVNGSFIVEPRNFKPFKVVVEDGMDKPRLEGTFTASGANNDIEVTVLSESQFHNWQNRNRFEASYQSGRVTAGKIELDLPAEPATYVVVFSNRFSIWSNKGVVADVKLRFDR